MIKKVTEIINGYKNYFIGCDENSQKIAEHRAKICVNCPAIKKGLHSAILPDYSISIIKGYYCSECGCPISPKIRSKTSVCPKNKW